MVEAFSAPDYELSQVAKEVQRRTNAKQSAVLRYLREGALTSILRLPTNPLLALAIPARVWSYMDDSAFKIRRRDHTGKTLNYHLKLKPIDVCPSLGQEVNSIALSAEREEMKRVEPTVLARWFPDLDVPDFDNLERARVSIRCREVLQLQKRRFPVFVTCTEYKRFFSEVVPPTSVVKHAGGAPLKFGEDAWLELIALLEPNRPNSQQKGLTGRLAEKLKKAGNPISESAIRGRVSNLYKHMGWA
jgi:hypothetical protein